ncbi:tankyrase-2 [Lingula anatina]|uniref:Tankyrase-2 n=1 Tax=Lingula anatina TaxID=7574 RepID=A0A1S3JB13_LINAN|nr:tankyrase-2 [Lingula anatina]XP_013407386.1 tankyrase-2 [Lingula anatina]|eukprot:XP_013407385.1 tankyrase-2 [Lingula anatina]
MVKVTNITAKKNKHCTNDERLHEAVLKNNLDAVKKLTKVECDVNARQTSGGKTALFYAVCYGRLDIAKALLHNGADPDLPEDRGNTPLHEAVEKADIYMVHLLLSHKADVNAQNQRKQTALSLSSLYGYVDIAETLLNNGALIDHYDNEGRTPLLIALHEGNEDMARLLISRDCDVHHCDDKGTSAFYLAIHSPNLRDISLARLLIATGYKVQQDKSWLCADHASPPGLFFSNRKFFYELTGQQITDSDECTNDFRRKSIKCKSFNQSKQLLHEYKQGLISDCVTHL